MYSILWLIIVFVEIKSQYTCSCVSFTIICGQFSSVCMILHSFIVIIVVKLNLQTTLLIKNNYSKQSMSVFRILDMDATGLHFN